jgi:hypothetical protein
MRGATDGNVQCLSRDFPFPDEPRPCRERDPVKPLPHLDRRPHSRLILIHYAIHKTRLLALPRLFAPHSGAVGFSGSSPIRRRRVGCRRAWLLRLFLPLS